MTYTEAGFSLKLGLQKIVFIEKLVLVLNQDLQQFPLYQETGA